MLEMLTAYVNRSASVTRKRRNELGWPAGFKWIRAASEAEGYC